MKSVYAFIAICISTVSFAQNEADFHISGMIFNAKAKTISLSQVTRAGVVNYAESTLDKDGNFDLKGKVPTEDYYSVKIGDQNINVIVRKGSDFKIYGDGNKLHKFCNVVGSDESNNLSKFTFVLDTWNQKKDSALAIIQKDQSQSTKVNADMQTAFTEFQEAYKTFLAENSSTPAIIGALGATDPAADFATYESIIQQLSVSFPQSPTVKSVLADFQQLKAQKEAANILAPGKPAPDFEDLMLDRKTKMKLSDLKGKVVLLDFWASWCGPCRKENPNVVRLYEKYKDKGFTVMSVSLDDNLQRWQQAIDADKLSWPYHVSDLKKWQCAAAKIYGVSGIPFTVLIDQQGNIVQTNLRGVQLEQALEKLLGK
jgi:thiol-disulfide isomerase/thioredoxin